MYILTNHFEDTYVHPDILPIRDSAVNVVVRLVEAYDSKAEPLAHAIQLATQRLQAMGGSINHPTRNSPRRTQQTTQDISRRQSQRLLAHHNRRHTPQQLGNQHAGHKERLQAISENHVPSPDQATTGGR